MNRNTGAATAARTGEDDMADDAKRKGTGLGRRAFFGVAAASGAAALAGGAAPAFAQEAPDERVKARYQETDHVKRFYETNRYYKGE